MTPEEFDRYADKLKSFGFTVYQNARASFVREAVFTDGTNIGRMEAGNDCIRKGVMLHTVCYPHREAKTGYAIQNYWDALSLDQLTEEKAREAFALTPSWKKDIPEGLHHYNDFRHWKMHSFLAKKYVYDSVLPSPMEGGQQSVRPLGRGSAHDSTNDKNN